MSQANFNRPRYFATPPDVCSFSTSGIDLPIEDGVIVVGSQDAAAACKEAGFMEINDPALLKDARLLMAVDVATKTTQQALGNGDSPDVARTKARIAVSNAGFELPQSLLDAEFVGEEEQAPVPQPRGKLSLKKKVA